MTFAPNTKRGKSAARFVAYSSARTVGEYRALNSESQFVNADLAINLDWGLAMLPPFVWAQRLSPLPLLAEAATLHPAPEGTLEDLHAFVLRVAGSMPDRRFLGMAPDDCLSLFYGDHLHTQATRLAAHDQSLAAGLRFELLENGSPSLPYVGGVLMREVLEHGPLIAATVGLRKDLTSVKAMLVLMHRLPRGSPGAR